MKFALNRYDLRYHAVLADPPPIPGAHPDRRPFGFPPTEMREIWIIEIENLEELLQMVRNLGKPIGICLSGYWSGRTIESPGHCLFGISVVDNPSFQVDSRDLPKLIKRREGM